MSNQPRPTEITADRNLGILTITWNDGHVSAYPFELVRRACPCAECRGGHDKMSGVPDPEVFNLPISNSPEARLRNLEGVGSYAITFEWEDGHHHGIYTWQYLRALCPCSECRGISEHGR
jgi:DUF971 family protein